MSKYSTKNLPPKFMQNISGLYGRKGEQWLQDLPEIIRQSCKKWSLKIETIFPNLSYNFVASCIDQEGEKFVLKIGVPEEDSPIMFEKKALEAFAGKGAVKVVKFDKNLHAMLLERAIEGKTLGEVCGEDYEKAVKIAIEVMQKLPRRPLNKNEFINLESWIEGLNKAVETNFQIEKISKAQKYFADLIEPFEKKILLHGDIHFDNILSAPGETFLVIDPKGVVGEIGYEIAVFLNDLAGWTEHLENQKAILNSALESFSESFKVSPENLRKWAFSFAILSAWWMMEDLGENQEKHILRADIWEV